MYVSVSSLRGGLCRFGEAWAALVGLWAEKLLTYLLSVSHRQRPSRHRPPAIDKVMCVGVRSHTIRLIKSVLL